MSWAPRIDCRADRTSAVNYGPLELKLCLFAGKRVLYASIWYKPNESDKNVET